MARNSAFEHPGFRVTREPMMKEDFIATTDRNPELPDLAYKQESA